VALHDAVGIGTEAGSGVDGFGDGASGNAAGCGGGEKLTLPTRSAQIFPLLPYSRSVI
jgi:hypothetical protein